MADEAILRVVLEGSGGAGRTGSAAGARSATTPPTPPTLLTTPPAPAPTTGGPSLPLSVDLGLFNVALTDATAGFNSLSQRLDSSTAELKSGFDIFVYALAIATDKLESLIPPSFSPPTGTGAGGFPIPLPVEITNFAAMPVSGLALPDPVHVEVTNVPLPVEITNFAAAPIPTLALPSPLWVNIGNVPLLVDVTNFPSHFPGQAPLPPGVHEAEYIQPVEVVNLPLLVTMVGGGGGGGGGPGGKRKGTDTASFSDYLRTLGGLLPGGLGGVVGKAGGAVEAAGAAGAGVAGSVASLGAAAAVAAAAVAAAAAAFIMAGRAVEQYAPYNPEIAVADAMADLRNTMNDMRRSVAIAPELTRFIKERSNLQQTYEDAKVEFMKAILPSVTDGMKILVTLVDLVGKVTVSSDAIGITLKSLFFGIIPQILDWLNSNKDENEKFAFLDEIMGTVNNDFGNLGRD